MKSLNYILIFMIGFQLYVCAQADSAYVIKLHFLYGSKPLKKYRPLEVKYFGGLHGGHVSIQMNNKDYGFEPTGRVHVFPHKRHLQSAYVVNTVSGKMRYDTTSKVTTFIIPLSRQQYEQLQQINDAYARNPPHDYAFFGMRCASTTRDILAQAGLLKKRNRLITIFGTFYPKRLRKELFELAKRRNYGVVQTTGRISRKWEKD